MKLIGGMVILLYIFFLIFIAVALVYVIIRQVEDHDREDFEKRKN